MRAIKRWYRAYHTFIISGLMLVFIVAAFAFGIIPTVEKIQSRFADTQVIASEVAALRQKVGVLDSLDEQTLGDQLAQVVATVPSDKSLATLFSTVDGITNQSSTLLVDMAISNLGAVSSGSATVNQTADERKIGASIMQFTISAQGTLEAVKALLAQTINVRRLLRVKHFAINVSDAEQVSIKMDMEAFFAPLPRLGASGEVSPLSEKEQQQLGNIVSIPLLGQDVSTDVPTAPTELKADPFAR